MHSSTVKSVLWLMTREERLYSSLGSGSKMKRDNVCLCEVVKMRYCVAGGKF